MRANARRSEMCAILAFISKGTEMNRFSKGSLLAGTIMAGAMIATPAYAQDTETNETAASEDNFIVDEEGQWREIVLHDGERGWLHGQLLSGARSLYVTAERAPIMSRAGQDGDVVAYAEPTVILRAKECGPAWCEVRKGGVSGWIARDKVWGLLPDETFD